MARGLGKFLLSAIILTQTVRNRKVFLGIRKKTPAAQKRQPAVGFDSVFIALPLPARIPPERSAVGRKGFFTEVVPSGTVPVGCPRWLLFLGTKQPCA